MSAVAPESSQPGLVQELKDRLFGRDDCHIIELGNTASSNGFLIVTVVIVCRIICIGAGTGIVSLVLAALRSANPTSDSASTSNRGTCILSTDLRESSHFFLRPAPVDSSKWGARFSYSVFDGAHVV